MIFVSLSSNIAAFHTARVLYTFCVYIYIYTLLVVIYVVLS